MPTDEFKNALAYRFPLAVCNDTGRYFTIEIDGDTAHELIWFLNRESETRYERLACLSGVDRQTHLEVVYHLDALIPKETIVVRAIIKDLDQPEIATVTDMWKGADLLECEVYDFFGIRFKHHPMLRRLFLDEDWVGYPLRKNYVDDINMITL